MENDWNIKENMKSIIIILFVQYGAVFDAGSSHTNMTVYSWPNDTRVDETGFVTQKATCRALGKNTQGFFYYFYLDQRGYICYPCLFFLLVGLSVNKIFRETCLKINCRPKINKIKNHDLFWRFFWSKNEYWRELRSKLWWLGILSRENRNNILSHLMPMNPDINYTV